MKLVNQSVTLLKQGYTINDIEKHIERCARTCYKSEARSRGEHHKFVERLIKSGHTSMLEHGTVYLSIPSDIFNPSIINSYMKVVNDIDLEAFYVTTNYRVIKENNLEYLLEFLCEPNILHKDRYTLKIITDIGIARELCRHRVFSFAQESTRYCNYSKDTFNNELSFIIPSWISAKLIDTNQNKDERGAWLAHSLRDAEISYMSMLNKGATPEQARAVLPMQLKTELCMTGYLSDWNRFLALRLRETTGKVHPDMKVLAKMIEDEIQKGQRLFSESD